ncbi:hypothetical protein ACMFCN_17495 [Klebsiella michiganensis]|uniref:hypothetical protein n=1 Tax=Klebsiella michiganensis TaxID=1134687 RepID=UPI003CFB9C1A
MINLTQKIEEAIHQVSVGAIKLSSLHGDLKAVLNALTINKKDYEEPVLYEIPDKYSNTFNRLSLSGELSELVLFTEQYGIKCSQDDSQAMSAAILLYSQSQFEIAQTVADRIYADRLRMRIYPNVLRDLQERAYKERLKENAKKPRNKHYSEAIRIAKDTWSRYPTASKNGMCQKLHGYFNGQVSIDTLDRWIKAAKIKPPVTSKATSFSLIL